MKEPIVLIGGGGHCKSCIDVIEQGEEYQIVGILDAPEKVGERILGYEIIGTDDDFIILLKTINNYLITVGQIKSAAKRAKLYSMVKNGGGSLPAIISPNAYVSKSATIGEGTIIMHKAIINAEANIGVNCIINSGALVEHEAIVGDFCHISTGAIINGQTKVGDRCFVGSNAVLTNNISISDEVIISAGSRVLTDLNTPGTYCDNRRL
ncbi:MAG TPA: acetyltransferase [Desulfobacteraceae bacterium]|nr:acetyltransferase [Desulfobacteraceae bacterium]HPQ27850.1 acetyltransferase [Desulfobacteraceae bacterium]